ncbi:MAG: Sir2 family NAD-dependent protein deacetylase [Flavobacteriales bacterium]
MIWAKGRKSRNIEPGQNVFYSFDIPGQNMKTIVVFSGAGMSAESGLTTFRDSGGLWEQYDVQQVATPEAWVANPKLVLEFYNKRRAQILKAEPNEAHRAIAKLEHQFEVKIITQNIDNLHERAGSTNVLHLHGDITKAKSSNGDPTLIESPIEIGYGDLAPDGSQLRPHVVWFGEPVTEFENARRLIKKAEIVLIIGTSLNVYPAAGLIFYAPQNSEVYLIDPADVSNPGLSKLKIMKENATVAVPRLVNELLVGNTTV